MKIDYLGNHSEGVPLIAQWSYDSWHQYDPMMTVERSKVISVLMIWSFSGMSRFNSMAMASF